MGITFSFIINERPTRPLARMHQGIELSLIDVGKNNLIKYVMFGNKAGLMWAKRIVRYNDDTATQESDDD
jgi:hypothetical protein